MAKKKPSKKTTTAMSTATVVPPPAPVLTAPFSWRDPAFQPFLERLQGNILKGHGRHHAMNLFFTIKTGEAEAARTALKLLATQYTTSSLKQLRETDDFKEARAKGEPFTSDPFLSIMLSKAGYDALGIAPALIPADPLFQAGMRASQATLNDPVTSKWDADFQTLPHGLILIAAETPEAVDVLTAKIDAIIKDGLTVTARQRGKAILNSRGEGLEHFGYVDGRSQPLYLLEDIATERGNAGNMMWNPAFSPDRVAIKDPSAPADDHAFGSYFIFRKLEEHVRDFKRREQLLADELGLTNDDRERAGALAVGRFEDGTPVTLSPDPVTPAHGRVPNDFNYDHDPSGGKCPFHAHIRKVNPRGSGLPDAIVRETIMARRGLTYEDKPRLVHPDDLPESKTLIEFEAKVASLLPEDGLGLLFMAYNVNIAQQFETTQSAWANSSTFPGNPAPGVTPGFDPVIGQPLDAAAPQQWPTTYTAGVPQFKPFDFRNFVTLLGGDYFFAPSLSFLRAL